MSQVLKGQVHLTPEQALGLTEFWELTTVERDYFLNMVFMERAGTKSLRQYYFSKLETLKKSNSQISKHVYEKDLHEDTTEEFLEYYTA